MVFVTGATGLVGSHLLCSLAKSGHTIVGLFRQGGNREAWQSVCPDAYCLADNIQMVEGDVLCRETLEPWVKQAECVYHCAAMVSFNGTDSSSLININLKGTENIASLCLEYGIRLCYVSSIAALGDARTEGELVDEETPEIAESIHSVYSHSKGTAEKIIWNYIRQGLNAVIVNPSIILGGGTWGRSSTRLFTTAVKGISVYTRGINGYVDVRDVCELMIRLAESKNIRGERFILNGGNYSYRELFTAITQAAGHRPPWICMTPWMTEIAWRILAAWGKITNKKPAFTFETARSAQRRAYYSNRKIIQQFPDFRFHSLKDTAEHLVVLYRNSSSGLPERKFL